MTDKKKINARLVILVLLMGIIIGAFGFVVFSGEGGGQKSQSGTEVVESIREPEIAGDFILGETAPQANFDDFEGNKHSLSDFRGHAVILDFWAAWCPFCVEEMPTLQAAQDKYGEELIMIGVHRTDTEKASTGLRFAEERGVSYMLVSDSNGELYSAATAGSFQGMPVALFIDKQGVVQDIKVGPKTEEEISNKIKDLLGEN